MTEMDRFAAFLAREAAGYNSPPATPADAMWAGVQARAGSIGAGRRVRVGDADAGPDGEVGGEAGGAGGPMFEALAYNAPPPVPREEMWTRIEAAWALRRSAAGKGAGPVPRARRRWPAPPGRKGWIAALAAAASLVLGIALGRGTRPDAPAETARVARTCGCRVRRGVGPGRTGEHRAGGTVVEETAELRRDGHDFGDRCPDRGGRSGDDGGNTGR